LIVPNELPHRLTIDPLQEISDTLSVRLKRRRYESLLDGTQEKQNRSKIRFEKLSGFSDHAKFTVNVLERWH
jgi:hypothetical protein